jgi:DNA polymerase (family 10)
MNAQVAEIFEQIADFMELKGENPFKIKAYQRAARTLEGLDQSVGELAQAGKLTGVPGIGKAIAEKIGEYLESGSVRVHQELCQEFPPQILELMDVPGLGARKAATLYHELRIGSIVELEKAIEAGSVRLIKGFGPKTEAKLLDGIRLLREGLQRLDLASARRLAARLIETLSQVPGVSRMTAAGSLRRGRETVGDLDLLCTAEDSQAVMESFCALVHPAKILVRGATKTSLLWDGSFQIDLRVVPAASFGAALQYFTGSVDHNVAMRGRAQSQGMKLNEYGLFDSENPDQARLDGGIEESDIYAALGLPWIAPELRESGHEIALAESGTLPVLVEEVDICGNLHTHSLWSDGHNSLDELAEAAVARGYRYLAITDHSRSLTVANGLSIERLLEQGQAIRALNEQFAGRLTILRGTECDILANGSLDFPDEVLADLDLVVAAVHSSMSMPAGEMTARIVRALNNPHVDILAHPSGRLIGRRKGYDADWDEIFRAAVRTGTRLEINCSARRLDLSDLACRRARELGACFSLGTDAHSLEEFNRMELGVTVARRAGLGSADLLNTMDLTELRAYLR